MGLVASPSLGRLQGRTVFTEPLRVRPLINFPSGGFEFIFENKVSSSYDSLDRSNVYIPHPTCTKAVCGAQGRDDRMAYLHHIILLSQKPDLKEIQVIHLDRRCASVWNI